MRAFIAVDFEATESLRGLLRELRSVQARVRVVPSENLHITLKFLGEVEEGLVPSIVHAMEESAKMGAPATVVLRGTGAFPSFRAPRVLWVGIAGGEVMVQVAEKLEERLRDLGFPREKRPFSPHLTVARVKGPKGKEELAGVMESHGDEVFGEQRVGEILLKRSELTPQGALYSDVASVPLG